LGKNKFKDYSNEFYPPHDMPLPVLCVVII